MTTLSERTVTGRTFFCLKNFLSKGTQRQLNRQIGRLVVLVDYRINFNDFETGHASMVGDDFHRQMALAISGAAADRRAHARSVLRIDPIHVERNVIAGGVAAGDTE